MELEFPGQQLVMDGIAEGILFNCTHDTVLRFLPPYIIKEADIDRGIRALTKVLKKAKADRKKS